VSIFGALENQRFIRELSVLADSVSQIGEGVLAILDGLANRVLNQPALKINRFPGRRRKLDTGCVF
jgi:hypothetical protein